MVGFRYFKLLLVYWILIFQMNFVFLVPGQPQVIFVQADGILMFEQDVDVFFLVFVRDL